MRLTSLMRVMRPMLAGAALGTLLLAATAQAEMVLRIGNVGEPETLDPHGAAGTWENRVIGDMFMGLTTEDVHAETVPGAAESWTVSDDGLTYTFKLRNHTWSDGVPVTADDFAYGLRRILDPGFPAKYASLLYPIANAELVKTGQEQIENLGVRAIDDKTLEIKLNSPTPYFIDQLTHYTAFPVPRHKVEELGADWIKPGNIVSNGPYTVVEWIPNSQITAVKNEKFHDAANVKVDKVIYYPDEDRNAVTKRFRAGEIDYAADFASEQIDWLKENLPAETRISPYLGIYYYPINNTRAPFSDERVRRALSMAIDREAIVDKVLKTGEIAAYSFVPPGTGNYGEPAYVEWKDLAYPERVAKAKALLEEAGFGPGNPLKLTLSYNTSENHKKIAIAVAAMWKQLGVEAELFNSEVKVHYNSLEENDFDVARAGWIADYNDPQNFLFLLQTSSGKLNYGRYSNPEFDKLMDEAAKTNNLDARAALLRQAEARMLADSATIPIYYYVSKNLVQQYVKGWEPNTKDIHRTRYITVER
jgi:oligopeptide transport system substrate-binding protein